MNPGTGEIRDFSSEIPEGWKKLSEGAVVSFNGLNFLIHNVDVWSQKVVLKPISEADVAKYASAAAAKKMTQAYEDAKD